MSNIISDSAVFLDVAASSVADAFTFIANKSVELGIATDADAVASALHEREDADSTGMINGFAIPHAKSDAVASPALVVVRFAQPVDWGKTQDGQPVHCAIALLTPAKDPTVHLRILAQVASMIVRDSFCKEVSSTNDSAQIASAIAANLDN